jgi:alpha-amylase/alpha-mannosidase (GH57 family)
MIRVCFLWHMHQPFYKDLISGEYRMPWTRLHALKDYLGMVEVMRDFPAVHATFNLVPSLMTQIEEYASGTAREPLLDIVLKPAEQLSREERLAALSQLFQTNPERLISRYPRYWELYERYHSAGFSPERALPLFADRDFADLQVLSQLAWFDEIYLDHDQDIRALVRKGRSYNPSDQQVIARKEREVIGRIVGAYREAQERGQVELSTTPFYHPILPLLCDTAVAEESRPGIRLPRRFRHPEDARLQLERAVALHLRLFGRAPAGLWPSEGSVSDEVVSTAAGLGFRWVATGEGVLARSLGTGFPRDSQGAPINAAVLYSSHEAELLPGRPMRMFFRDHYLSDLIGFVYSKMEARDAARDLLARLRRCGRAAYSGASDPVVSVILDGENAWEYYERSGREFFRALYQGFTSDSEMRAVTFSEALAVPPRTRLTHVVPGSWINANFDIWIGAEEDNRAWDLLSDGRDFFAQAEQRGQASREQLDLAREEVLVAEGSDWNWWYGPEHHSANDPEFDQLYRSHLANVYRALGAPPPDALAAPISREQVPAFSSPPANYIRPKIDGYFTSYFEWMGAGIYGLDQRTSAMHGKRFYLREVRYGLDGPNFYLLLDFTPEGLRALEGAEIRVNFALDRAGPGLTARVSARLDGDRRDVTLAVREANGEVSAASAEHFAAAFRSVFELRAALQALGLAGAAKFRFQVILWEGGLPVDVIPAQGWLELETAEPLQER